MELDCLLDALARCRPEGIGVSAWSVHATAQRRLTLGTRDGETGNAHTPLSFSESLDTRYLLVWEDDRISRGSLEKRQLVEQPEQALAAARAGAYDDPDAAQVRGPASFPEPILADTAAAALVAGDTTPLGRRLSRIREVFRASEFRTWSGSFSATDSRTRLVTSEGLDAEERGTSAGWHVSFEGEWGDGFGARAFEAEAEFERRLESLARTVALLGGPTATLSPGTHPVILHPHAVEDFVLGTLLRNLDGSVVAHGEGFFKKAEFGSNRPVLREDLSLTLDPLQPLKSGSYRFTLEGVPAARCEYIDDGRLVTPCLNLKYARRLGMRPTPLPYALDTLQLTASRPIPETAAWERAAGGVLVLSLLGVHTQDPASGDFSLSAPQALGIGPSGPAGRIRATLSGNLFRILSSDDLVTVSFEGESTPGLLVRCRVDAA